MGTNANTRRSVKKTELKLTIFRPLDLLFIRVLTKTIQKTLLYSSFMHFDYSGLKSSFIRLLSGLRHGANQ